MPFRKTENQLKDYIFILFLVVGIPYIIGQVIYEQWGGVGCLAPLVGCGALFGLLALVSTFKEDNGDTKISFEPPARDEKSHEMAVAMVRQMVGKQIRLVSVHWSDSERDEYLYTPDIEHSDKRRRVGSWMDEPTKDILSKSRYMVEPVKGEEHQIRFASVHWSNLERYEYLYSPDIDYSLNSKEMREVASWMDEQQKTSSPSRDTWLSLFRGRKMKSVSSPFTGLTQRDTNTSTHRDNSRTRRGEIFILGRANQRMIFSPSPATE